MQRSDWRRDLGERSLAKGGVPSFPAILLALLGMCLFLKYDRISL